MTDHQEASPSPNSAPNSPADQTIFDPQFWQSLDLVEENIKTLKRLFPDIVKEGKTGGKIDFDRLREILGEEIDTEEEPYSFTWHGKRAALRLAQTPSMGTLRPCKEESVDWENTQNLMIEGDNLEVLKLLQKSYYGKIKMIYIDPPYNTGNDFVYRDDYKDPLAHYLEETGQIDEAGRKTSTNTNTSGRYHTNWLNMIYPRLRLARNLLRDDGVLFISIDDNEQANLKKLCDEVFGSENFIAQFVQAAGRKNNSRYVSVSHEYILTYVKNKSYLGEQNIKWHIRKEGLDKIYAKHKDLIKHYGENYVAAEQALREWYKQLPDNEPAKRIGEQYKYIDTRGIYRPDNISVIDSGNSAGGPRYDVLHPVTGKPCKVSSRGWCFNTPEKMQEMI
ncbi:MAG: site-specific DNA-methyltransferase, partial [Acetobacter sp.]|nr:site-specific DNA-methyltransferase [Acetobacter sp.]